MPRIPFRLNDCDLVYSAMRAQGAGGQNVNKVSSAIQLRFDSQAADLPEELKQRILTYADQRITAEGVIVIKAQEHRTQEQNKCDAYERLLELLRRLAFTPKARKETKPTQASKRKRLERKGMRSEIKKLRRDVDA